MGFVSLESQSSNDSPAIAANTAGITSAQADIATNTGNVADHETRLVTVEGAVAGFSGTTFLNEELVFVAGQVGPGRTFGGYGTFRLPAAQQQSTELIIKAQVLNVRANSICTLAAGIDGGPGAIVNLSHSMATDQTMNGLMTIAVPAGATDLTYSAAGVDGGGAYIVSFSLTQIARQT